MPSKVYPKAVKASNSEQILPVAAFADGTGQSLSVTTTTARKALNTNGYNIITVTAFGCAMLLRLGDSSVVAATTDQGFSVVLLDGTSVDIVNPDVVTNTNIAAIATSGSGTLYITYRV